jgi:hypothetical protein
MRSQATTFARYTLETPPIRDNENVQMRYAMDVARLAPEKTVRDPDVRMRQMSAQAKPASRDSKPDRQQTIEQEKRCCRY